MHHIPNGLDRSLNNIANSSKKGLCYLYYDFENRKKVFKFIFKLSNYLRLILCNIENNKFRIIITYFLTIFLYYPFILVGKVFKKIRLKEINLPLNYYIGMEFNRVAQDCYDRFFTNIENRYSKEMIKDIFIKHYSNIQISKKRPHWHFNLSN